MARPRSPAPGDGRRHAPAWDPADIGAAVGAYVLAVACGAGVLAAADAMQGPFGGVLYSLPLAVTAVLALVLGEGPALTFSTIVGLGLWYFVEVPARSFAITDRHAVGRLVAYFVASWVIVVAIGLLHRTRRNLEQARASLAAETEIASEARKEVEEREAALAAAQKVANVGSWQLEADEFSLGWSAQMYRIFGLPEGRRAPTFDDVMLMVHPADRDVVRAVVSDLARKRAGATAEVEHRVVRPDGVERVVLSRGELVRTKDGTREIIGTVLDITERKRAEEALREADRRKDQFLAVLSHELRNPLAPIKNSLYVLGRVPHGSEQAERARQVIERQVDHVTRLVGDLLDVSRIARGKTQLQRQRLDLRQVVAHALDDHRSVLASRGIRLQSGIPESPVWVDGDPVRLGQSLGNLLHNAAKFTPRGGEVAVTARAEGEWAVVTVRDSGVGIEADMLGRLFEPFAQADRTLDRSAGGLGLGLALVKGFVELHGGRVSARSEGPGKGAELTIRLPLAQAPVSRVAPTSGEPRAQHALRVLVIEDNVDAAESLEEALELDGHEVAVAHDGQEGLDKARVFAPDVVLCDIGLPTMDGYEVARAIRADGALHDVALVALTGYALAEDLARAAQAGFDRHLAKPPDLGTLERVLAEVHPRSAA